MMIGYVLLALGVAVFVLSFVLPAKSEEEKEKEFSEDLIREMVGKEVESAKTQITDIVDETINYAMEKTERSLDRLTNEKIMAVNEYSDTVLGEINKNQQEVVFLYDMLNDKHETLKDTVSEMDKKTSEVKQAVLDAEITAKETRERMEEVSKQAEQVSSEFEPFIPAKFDQMTAPSTSAEDNGRVSALERLKAAKTADEVGSLNDDIVEEPKPQRKKRTTKPKVREEAVSFSDDNDTNFGVEPQLITASEEEVVKIRKDGPSLNLGTDAAGKPMGGRNNNEKILELHNKGKSNMAIAKELGLGIGEVKLVIDLFEGM